MTAFLATALKLHIPGNTSRVGIIWKLKFDANRCIQIISMLLFRNEVKRFQFE